MNRIVVRPRNPSNRYVVRSTTGASGIGHLRLVLGWT